MTVLTLEQLIGRILEPRRTLILTHASPDPDTIGSAFGLKKILTALGSEVRVVCADRVAHRMDFLIDAPEELTYEGDGSDYERIVAVDVASPSQLGELSRLADRTDLLIDHHANNSHFADVYREYIAAAAEIVFDLSEELIRRGCIKELPRSFYECIYAGIASDTGSFRYSNVTSDTHARAAKLLTHGIDFAEISRLLFDSHTPKELIAQKVVLAHMKYFADGQICAVLFTNQMKRENGLEDVDLENIIATVREIEGVKIGLTVKQSTADERKFRVSSRANCDFNVAEVCAAFGGGGHPRAAGASLIADTPEDAFDTVVNAFSRALTDRQKGE